MKLTGNLKKQVESAPTKEEKREAVKQAGMLCSDDELDQVSGGVTRGGDVCPYNPYCGFSFERSVKCVACALRQE